MYGREFLYFLCAPPDVLPPVVFPSGASAGASTADDCATRTPVCSCSSLIIPACSLSVPACSVIVPACSVIVPACSVIVSSILLIFTQAVVTIMNDTTNKTEMSPHPFHRLRFRLSASTLALSFSPLLLVVVTVVSMVKPRLLVLVRLLVLARLLVRACRSASSTGAPRTACRGGGAA